MYPVNGYLLDPHDSRDFPFEETRFGLVSVPPEFDLSPHLQGQLWQGNTEGCVGWSLAHAIWAGLAIVTNDAPIAPPSPLFAWWVSRQTHGQQMLNVGTYLRTGIQQAIKVGVCPERFWPSDSPEFDFAKQPSDPAFVRAMDHRWPMAYYRIGSGYSAEMAIKRAISQGQPVQFGCRVTEEFVQAREHSYFPAPGTYGTSSAIVGGHAMTALGYDDKGIWGPNSWRAHGNGGWFSLSWEYIHSEYMIDIWAIHMTEKPVKGWW